MLAQLPHAVGRPAYDPAGVRIGVIHFGPGAFHRAHQGDYFDRLLASDPRWGIAAVSLRTPDTVEALKAQRGLYSLSILDREPSVRVLAPHRAWMGPGEEPRLLELLRDPGVRLVTATVTEKGYCLDGRGELDGSHPDIAHDLGNFHAPRSFPGWIVAGLAARRSAGLPPFAVLSCDNLAGNGRKLRGAVVALSAAHDPELARWIEGEAHFPDTMVDSITPASDPAFLAATAARLGCEDKAAVKREAFAQWVIARTEGAGLPDLESAGVIFTGDVALWERAKLRILNGAHSSLAYLGILRDHDSVAEAMADRELADFVRAMIVEEVWPSLATTEGFDLAAYTKGVFGRFANPAIEHRLSQIAWDGSQKLPYRLLGTIVDAIAAGRPFDRLAAAVAGWMAFCCRRTSEGQELVDPLAKPLARAAEAAREQGSADPFLGLESVFPDAVTRHPVFRELVTTWLKRLLNDERSLYSPLAK